MTVSNVIPRPNDVFLGRGGSKENTLYRKLVRKHSKAYSELQNGEKRDFIVANIVEPILKTGGVFYNHNPCDTFGIWRIASDDEIIKKIRSALTEHRKKQLISGSDEDEEADNDSNCEEVRKDIGVANLNAGKKRKATESCYNRRMIAPPDFSSSQLRSADSFNSRNISPQTSLYLNEKTGHLLNVSSRDNIYHRLLTQHAASFNEIFHGVEVNNFLNENNKIRYVWDNILSELQKANCSIVLCPESRKSVDVDPKDLEIFGRDPKRNSITFRTIKCIISALTDLEYIASERSLMRLVSFGQESAHTIQPQYHASTRHNESNLELIKKSMHSIAASDDIYRRATPQHQQFLRYLAPHRQNPMMVSFDSSSIHTNQSPSTENDFRGPNNRSDLVSQLQQTSDPPREVLLSMLRMENSKIRETIETAKIIENAERESARMAMERNRQLDLLRHSVSDSTATVSTLGVRTKTGLSASSLPFPVGWNEQRVGTVQNAAAEKKGEKKAMKHINRKR